MSNSPNFTSKEFVTAGILNGAAATTLSAQHDTNGQLHTPGLVNASAASYAASGMVVTATLSAPFCVEFGSGALSFAHGTATNADTQTYAVNFASLVPGSGSVTAYLLAAATTIQQSPYTVIGPPQGHPSYNPNFVPSTAYSANVESLALTASLTAPDNLTTFELCRTTLTAGQTGITSISTASIQQASSILAPTGVVAGTYQSPNVTVGADGRLTYAVSTGPFVLLTAANQTITGNVNVDGNVNITGTTTVASGTTGNEAVNFSQFVTSEAGLGGAIQLPNNITMQLGTVEAGVENPNTVTFTIPFPTVCLGVFFTEQNAVGSWGSDAPTVYGASSVTREGFQVYGLKWNGSEWEASGGTSCQFIAVGF